MACSGVWLAGTRQSLGGAFWGGDPPRTPTSDPSNKTASSESRGRPGIQRITMDGDTLNGGEGLAYEPGMQSEKMELTDAELGGKGEPSTEMNGVGGIENPAFSVSESDEIIDTSRNRPNTANTDKEDIERRAPSVKRYEEKLS